LGITTTLFELNYHNSVIRTTERRCSVYYQWEIIYQYWMHRFIASS